MENYQNGIPDNVTSVFISNDLDQSYYQHIFNSDIVDGHYDGRIWDHPVFVKNAKYHVTMHDVIKEIEYEAFQSCNLMKSIRMPTNIQPESVYSSF